MKETEDPSKPDASEENNSHKWRDEPLAPPLDEEENYYPNEERGVASRFLSLLRKIARGIKRTLGKFRYTQDSDLSSDFDASEYADEEIIFPQGKREGRKVFPKKGQGAKSIRVLRWITILLFVFLLGHLTRPEVIKNTLQTVTQWSSVFFEKVAPVKEKISERVTEIVEKKEPETKETQRKIKYWKAPMTPGFTSDKPGKSPMGMDLVPVYEGEEEQPEEDLRISPTIVQNIGVKTEKIEKRTLSKQIRTVGILTYDERKVTHIHTKYKGWVEKLYVDFTGQEVNKGDLLAEIYSPELVSTQEELLVALKYRQSLKESPFTEIGKGAERLYESTRRRLELFDVPEHQIEELIREKKITKTLHIHSPFRGFVVKKDASQGMFVQPGMSLYTIADLSNIWVMADVYEYELPWIQVGQRAQMSLSYYPGREFKGKVTYIDPFMDPKTRTLKVRMEFDNPKWELKPDMYANVTLKSTISKKSVAVPEEAVIRSGEKEIVIVRNPSGTFESRELTLGAQANGYYQVLKGLKAGETVVTSSSFLIDSESKLKEALGKLQAGKTGQGKMKKIDRSKMSEEGKQKKPPGIVEVHPDELDMKSSDH